MEQGSSAAKSLPNSNKRKQSFTDELHDIVNSSSQDFSAERETRYSIPQTSQYQTSNLEGAPIFSQSRQPQFSRGPSQVPFESSGIDATFNTGMHNAYSVPHAQNTGMTLENLDLPRPMRSQGFPYPLNTPNGFDISNNGKSPTTSAPKAPYDSPMSGLLNAVAAQRTYPTQQAQNSAASVESPLPFSTTQGIPYPMNPPSGSNGPSSSSLKRKAPSQDGTPPNYQSWNSNFGRGLHRYSSSCNNVGRYSLYDKRYEDVGLPVDPHLRIFIATNGNGNGDSSSRKRD
ncbi:hypothetical protein AAHA92_12978 [Salvia divinorum]|uniref:Uncharacterized protein n=1 Tax=Salvia divinorum TaxID=28513 RepID=A0ABD1H6T2_SALDI